MHVVNETDLKTHSFSAHDGEGKMDIKFAFSEFERFSNDNDSGWLFFGIAELPEGATAGTHKHEGDDEFFYILDGEAIIVQDGEEKKVVKGDIVLTRSGSEHSIKEVVRKLKFITVEIKRTQSE